MPWAEEDGADAIMNYKKHCAAKRPINVAPLSDMALPSFDQVTDLEWLQRG